VDSGVEYQGLVLSHLDSLYNYPLVLTRRSEDAEDLDAPEAPEVNQ
jgi:hypothetical protein